MTRELPSWMFWSTRASIDKEVPSVAAMIETCLAVLLYWWFAIHFQTYLLLVISVVVAPLVLLRSDQSVAFGVKWFAEWEGITWDETKIARTNKWLAWFLAIPAALSSFLILYLIAPSLAILKPPEGAGAAFGRGWSVFLFVCWAGATVAEIIAWAGSAVRVAMRAPTAAPGDVSARAFLLATFGTVAGAVARVIDAPPTSAAVAVAVGTAVCPVSLILLFGLGRSGRAPSPEPLALFRFVHRSVGTLLGVFVVSLIVRFGSTLYHVRQGVRELPRNFRRLTLCTSPLQEPELLPGLVPGNTRFTLTDLLRSLRTDGLYLGVAGVVWLLPGWMYRITLKSTVWLWWPLAFLSSPPKLASKPAWFHAKIAETRWARLTRLACYFSIILFIISSFCRTTMKGTLPENPFLNVVGYSFSVDWSTTPWQLLGVAGSLLSLTSYYLVDWNYRKYCVANDTQDPSLAREALLQFVWIERLTRVRSLLFLAYCALVGFHALLVFNSHSCWFIPSDTLQASAETVYGEYTPVPECIKPISK
ncbi:hypothetical protein [Bradyrhizobium sp. SZCCHNG3015]|uniref:hypothetical protein n=1 Tax=Bradyrhizobium sp. SZCCHNG3015 TaxID=3057270 RepID=UPI0028E21FEA|nr:hypothetical protein [Bradyrhizobium sp. SZCCHNG3015]